MRHNEEVVNEQLADKLPWPVERSRFDSPHVKANLLLTSMHVDDRENMSDGDAVSLLHAGNRKQAREALENILLCCAGGGEMVKQPHAGVLEELRRLLRKVPGADAAKVDDACAFFATARSERACAVCGIRLSYLLVAPCCCVL